MPFFIADACIDVMDRSCIDECPVDCIYEGGRKLYINPRECIDCGACEPACPQSAIYTDINPPAEVAEYIEDNRRFFAELLPGQAAPVGNPGGSAKIGPIGVDTPVVASYRTDASGA